MEIVKEVREMPSLEKTAFLLLQKLKVLAMTVYFKK
jgi:hypothetical protein